MCSGSRRSSSRPARQSRLMNPETSRVETIVARIRNSKLLADTAAANATKMTAKQKSNPPRVIRYRIRRRTAARSWLKRLRTRVQSRFYCCIRGRPRPGVGTTLKTIWIQSTNPHGHRCFHERTTESLHLPTTVGGSGGARAFDGPQGEKEVRGGRLGWSFD